MYAGPASIHPPLGAVSRAPRKTIGKPNPVVEANRDGYGYHPHD
jgi:hypothetical protein